MTSPNYDPALSLNLGFRPTTTPNPRLAPPDSDVNLSLSLSLTAVNANTNKSPPPPPPQIRHVASPRSAVSSLSLSNCSAKRSRDPPAPTASVTVSEEVDRNHSSTKSDDEEEELVRAHSNVRKKLRLNKDQSALLEDSFKLHSTLNPKQKSALAKQLNLRPRQVEVWFQNRRARTKFKQTEVDCELLKKWCESLTNENRRLQKEIQELRSVKVAAQAPFYMQLPAATLTMCPSCERITDSATEGGQVRRR